MFSKRYISRNIYLLFLLLFAENCLAQVDTIICTGRYLQNKICYSETKKNGQRGSYFVLDTLSGDSAVLNTEFANSYRFENGFIIAHEGDMRGLLTLQGKEIVSRCHFISFDVKDSLIQVWLCSTGWRIIDFHGNIIAGYNCYKCGMDNVHVQTQKNYFAVPCCAWQFALMDRNGTWITDAVFSSIGDFTNGKAPATLLNGEKGMLDTTGMFVDSAGKQINFRGLKFIDPNILSPCHIIQNGKVTSIGSNVKAGNSDKKNNSSSQNSIPTNNRQSAAFSYPLTNYQVIDKYDHYKIIEASTLESDFARQTTYSSNKFFLTDTLTKDSIELKTEGGLWYRFDHGLINAKIGDQRRLLTIDGKTIIELTYNFNFNSDLRLVSANDASNQFFWQLNNFDGKLLASLQYTSGFTDSEARMKPNPDGIYFAAPYYDKKFAVMDTSGTWLTEPVFDSIGKFENGNAIAKYNGHKGIVTEKGIFTYTDSVGKINLGGMEKPFAGMGAPYRYMNKKNKIVCGIKNEIPPASSVTKQVPPSQLVFPSKLQLPTNTSNLVTNPIGEFPKDTSTLFAFHDFADQSHYKILWRYSDLMKDNAYAHYSTFKIPYDKNVQDYFLVDTLLKDTFSLIQQTFLYGARFSPSFIFLQISSYQFNGQKVFTLKGIPVLPDAAYLTFDANDSVIIANNYPRGWNLYNWKQELLYSDSTLRGHDGQGYCVGFHLLVSGKTIDTLEKRTLYGLMKPNGNFITDLIFEKIENFDSTGTARAILCDNTWGKIDTTGKFKADNSNEWKQITISSLLADTAYTRIKCPKYKFSEKRGSYDLYIHSYCYDKHTIVRKRHWIYSRYYLNGKLIAEEKHNSHAHLQVITYKNGKKKKRIVNRHYTPKRRSHIL